MLGKLLKLTKEVCKSLIIKMLRHLLPQRDFAAYEPSSTRPYSCATPHAIRFVCVNVTIQAQADDT